MRAGRERHAGSRAQSHPNSLSLAGFRDSLQTQRHFTETAAREKSRRRPRETS